MSAACACPEREEFDPAPSYVIIDDPPSTTYYTRPADLGWMEGARVAVSDENIIVTYATVDGSRWEVEYRRKGGIVFR